MCRNIRVGVAALAMAACLSFSCLSQDWIKTSAPAKNWLSIACSADGSNVIAAATFDTSTNNDGLYSSLWISTNSGVTWLSNSAPAEAWIYAACSADGIHFFAFGQGEGFFISTNQGNTWTRSTPGTSDYHWTRVASSGNGRKLLVGGFYTPPPDYLGMSAVSVSTDGGATWSEPLTTGDFLTTTTGVASSGDGSRLSAVSDGGLLLLSTNRGETFTTNLLSSDNANPFYALSCSIDGEILFTARSSISLAMNGIFVSTNAGSAWKGPDFWDVSRRMSIGCSAYGQKLFAADSTIHTSDDFGVSWSTDPVQLTNLRAVACSADGRRVYAAAEGDGIYVKQMSSAPALRTGFSAGRLQLSWLLPSESYVLQESYTLTSQDWTNSTASAVLNFTNLHNEVSLPTGSGAAFYRLALQ